MLASISSCLRVVDDTVADYFAGGSICASFVVFGALSVLLYKPWRRNVDKKRQIRNQPGELVDEDEADVVNPADDLEGGVVRSYGSVEEEVLPPSELTHGPKHKSAAGDNIDDLQIIQAPKR